MNVKPINSFQRLPQLGKFGKVQESPENELSVQTSTGCDITDAIHQCDQQSASTIKFKHGKKGSVKCVDSLIRPLSESKISTVKSGVKHCSRENSECASKNASNKNSACLKVSTEKPSGSAAGRETTNSHDEGSHQTDVVNGSASKQQCRIGKCWPSTTPHARILCDF